MKAQQKINRVFKEDVISQKDIQSLFISYIYEEDDPKKTPNKRFNYLFMDKQVFPTLENTSEVKRKTKLLKESFYAHAEVMNNSELEDIYSETENTYVQKLMKQNRRLSSF